MNPQRNCYGAYGQGLGYNMEVGRVCNYMSLMAPYIILLRKPHYHKMQDANTGQHSEHVPRLRTFFVRIAQCSEYCFWGFRVPSV